MAYKKKNIKVGQDSYNQKEIDKLAGELIAGAAMGGAGGKVASVVGKGFKKALSKSGADIDDVEVPFKQQLEEVMKYAKRDAPGLMKKKNAIAAKPKSKFRESETGLELREITRDAQKGASDTKQLLSKIDKDETMAAGTMESKFGKGAKDLVSTKTSDHLKKQLIAHKHTMKSNTENLSDAAKAKIQSMLDSGKITSREAKKLGL